VVSHRRFGLPTFYTSAMWLFVCVYYLSLFGPLLLLPIVWSKMFSLQKSAFAMTITTLLSLSYGFLLAALAFKSTLLGPDYSDRLFLTVQAQSASGFILFLLALRKSPVRVLLASSALTISLAWFLIWAINTTV
jgi:hypothetical protein